MGITTFSFEISSKPSRNNTFPIYLRITQNRKLKRRKTSIELKRKNDFNSRTKNGNWVRTKEPNAAKWNEELAKELENAKQTFRDLKEEGSATSENIINKIENEEITPSFVAYANKRTAELYDEGMIRTWKKYRVFNNKMQAFLKRKHKIDLTFKEITPALLSDFQNFLYGTNSKHPDLKLHKNTVEVNLNIFRAILYRAIKIEELTEKNPFMKFKYRGEPTTKEKLTETEIERIKALNIPKGSPLWHCRNYFMFSYYCAGIRCGDFMQLRWRNIVEGRLEYQMDKNNKTRNLKLVPEALEILSYYKPQKEAKAKDYIFPLLNNTEAYAKTIKSELLSSELKLRLLQQISAKNAILNKELKEIAKLAEIEKTISFHIARHSFASIAKNKGVSNGKIKEMLGHSSLKQTEKYMGNFASEEIDKSLEQVFTPTKQPETSQQQIIEMLAKMKPQQRAELLKQLQTTK